MSGVQKLAALGGQALSDCTPRMTAECSQLAGKLFSGISELAFIKNGFLAFESALLVHPAGDPSNRLGLEQWNAATSWRMAYGALAFDCLFFASDAVGGQFCIWHDAVFRFDPETGVRERLSNTIEQWASLMLSDYSQHTMYPLAHAWQVSHGALAVGKRLVPKMPFVLGGEYSPSNLHAVDAIQAMLFYGDLARQIQHLPDGAQVRLRVID